MKTPLPYVVLKAQMLTRQNAELKSFMLDTMREISTLADDDKVHFARKLIDQILAPEAEKSSCQRGCHYCCYQTISLAKPEAKLISNFLSKADPSRWEKQKAHYERKENIDYEDKACVFLKSGECSIYEQRPLICRITYVENDPELCHLLNQGKSIKHRPVTKAALVAAAFYMTCPTTDLLPLALQNDL